MNTTTFTSLTLLFLMTGCAPLHDLPRTGAALEGRVLSANLETKTRTYTAQQRVGSVKTRDSKGRAVGTSDVYVNRTETQDYKIWRPTLGGEPVDEEDFYRLAGDLERAEMIRERRASAHQSARLGMYGGGALLVVGVAGLITAVSLPEETSRDIGGPVMLIGVSSAVVGGIGYFMGLESNKRLAPGYRFTRAKDAEEAMKAMKAPPEEDEVPSRYRAVQ